MRSEHVVKRVETVSEKRRQTCCEKQGEQHSEHVMENVETRCGYLVKHVVKKRVDIL